MRPAPPLTSLAACLALSLAAGCVLQRGTGVRADGRATVPLVRIAPAGLDGYVLVHGLELRPNGDRALLLSARGPLDIEPPVTPSTPHSLAVFAASGAFRGLFPLPCSDYNSSTVMTRGDDGTVYVACLGPTPVSRGLTDASPSEMRHELVLTVLGPEDSAPRRVQFEIGPMISLTSLAAGPDRTLALGGLGSAYETAVLRVAADGRTLARRDLGRVSQFGPRLASLPDGDLLVAGMEPMPGGARSTIRVFRLASSDLATRWEQPLRAIEGMLPAAAFASLSVDARSGQVYVGSTLGVEERAEFSAGISALGMEDGAVRWQRMFGDTHGVELDTVGALPGGGALVVMQLEGSGARPVTLAFGGERFRNDRRFDHDRVLGWLGPDGAPRRAEQWEMRSHGHGGSSVFVFPRFQPDGRAVIAANFYRSMRAHGRWVEGPWQSVPCPAYSRCGPERAPKRKEPRMPPPPPQCCEPRGRAPSTGMLVSFE